MAGRGTREVATRQTGRLYRGLVKRDLSRVAPQCHRGVMPGRPALTVGLGVPPTTWTQLSSALVAASYSSAEVREGLGALLLGGSDPAHRRRVGASCDTHLDQHDPQTSGVVLLGGVLRGGVLRGGVLGSVGRSLSRRGSRRPIR